jgi:tRNA-2-methylthio-N6-dimethylallyladenosine synthase
MNVHDSEKIAGLLAAEGMTEGESAHDADLVVFNTCSIREKAEQKFLSELGRLRKIKALKPGLRIAVAGCIAQQMGDELFRRAPFVDFVLGPQNIHALPEMVMGGNRLRIEENPGLALMQLPAARKEKGRAWVNIMYGCNNFCTYCIVPYTRGRERSRPMGSIVSEIRGLIDLGCVEVTLLGQNVNSYKDEKGGFPDLLRAVDAIAGLRRVRFVTSHPRDLTPALIDAMAELPSVCEHIHLPLQSGSTRILGLMNRRYTYEEYRSKVEMLRARIPGIAITSDIIAGFPSETEEDHEATIQAIRETGYDGLFAFKYSTRPGTRAETLGGHLDEGVKLSRLLDILALQDEITLDINRSLVGKTFEVLVEGPSETDPAKIAGRTRTNKIVTFISGTSGTSGAPGDVRPNEIVVIEITGARKHSLDGILVAGNP